MSLLSQSATRRAALWSIMAMGLMLVSIVLPTANGIDSRSGPPSPSENRIAATSSRSNADTNPNSGAEVIADADPEPPVARHPQVAVSGPDPDPPSPPDPAPPSPKVIAARETSRKGEHEPSVQHDEPKMEPTAPDSPPPTVTEITDPVVKTVVLVALTEELKENYSVSRNQLLALAKLQDDRMVGSKIFVLHPEGLAAISEASWLDHPPFASNPSLPDVLDAAAKQLEGKVPPKAKLLFVWPSSSVSVPKPGAGANIGTLPTLPERRHFLWARSDSSQIDDSVKTYLHNRFPNRDGDDIRGWIPVSAGELSSFIQDAL